MLPLLFCSTSFSATYYVDFADGTDGNDGLTAAKPFQHSPGDSAAKDVLGLDHDAEGSGMREESPEPEHPGGERPVQEPRVMGVGLNSGNRIVALPSAVDPGHSGVGRGADGALHSRSSVDAGRR